MRLIGKPLELTLNLIKQMKDDAKASASIEVAMSLVYTIEALQQENEQLKNENTSIRNWNACEEELYNELLESDKRRWELESELEDANNYREGLEVIVDKLRAQVAAMREALRKAREALKGVNVVRCPYCWGKETHSDKCEISKALVEIDKAIGGGDVDKG